MRRFVFLTMVALVMAVVLASPAWAATFTVDRIDDPDLSTTPTADECTDAANDCSLRGAITAANANVGDDTIDIGVTGTVNLTAALPDLSTSIAIEGPGDDQLTVRRDTGGDYRIFTVTGDTTTEVSISGMTISNGNANNCGGISHEDNGTLAISGSTISGNTAVLNGGGICIRSFPSTLTVTDSTISGNSAGIIGGGIDNGSDGSVTVTGSTISGNTVAGASFGSGAGGGIHNDHNGPLTITDSTISGNTVAGASFGGGEGGGIYNTGPLTITNSTISGNTARASADGSFGGGEGGGILSEIFADGTTTRIINSTISGNTAAGDGAIGGGVFNSRGATVIEFSTITLNTASDGAGSGVASFGDDRTGTEVLSSIISANQATDVDFVEGTTNTFLSRGYNLIGDGNATAAFNQTGDTTGVSDPNLGDLADNGGPTMTHALLTGSPAIDKGPPSTSCPPPDTDQRGVSRPQGSACDIGSFELEELDTQAPKVISTFPRDGGEVGPAANIRATFSEEMQEASVINAFKLFRKGSTNQIDAVVTYDADTHIATLNPTNNLRRGATYKAVVTTQAMDMAGNRLDQNDSRDGLQRKVWFFEIDN